MREERRGEGAQAGKGEDRRKYKRKDRKKGGKRVLFKIHSCDCGSTMGAILAEQVKQVWGEKVRVSDGASVTQVLNELQEGSHTAPLLRQTSFTFLLWSGGRGFGVSLWGWRKEEEEEMKGKLHTQHCTTSTLCQYLALFRLGVVGTFPPSWSTWRFNSVITSSADKES